MNPGGGRRRAALPGAAVGGFTWGPGGAFGVSPGILAGRLGFHLASCGAFGVSPGILAGRLGFHLASWRGVWGFT